MEVFQRKEVPQDLKGPCYLRQLGECGKEVLHLCLEWKRGSTRFGLRGVYFLSFLLCITLIKLIFVATPMWPCHCNTFLKRVVFVIQVS